MTFNSPRAGQDSRHELLGAFGFPGGHTGDSAGQPGKAQRVHGGPAAVDSGSRGSFTAEFFDCLPDLLLHERIGAQVVFRPSAGDLLRHEEGGVLAGAVEEQARCGHAAHAHGRTVISVSRCAGRALEVVFAEVDRGQHVLHDRHVIGFCPVAGACDNSGVAGQRHAQLHARDRLERFEAGSNEHGLFRCADRGDDGTTGVHDDRRTDVPRFDEVGTGYDGELFGTVCGEGLHALHPKRRPARGHV